MTGVIGCDHKNHNYNAAVVSLKVFALQTPLLAILVFHIVSFSSFRSFLIFEQRFCIVSAPGISGVASQPGTGAVPAVPAVPSHGSCGPGEFADGRDAGAGVADADTAAGTAAGVAYHRGRKSADVKRRSLRVHWIVDTW